MRYATVICLLMIAWLSCSCSDHIVYHAYHPFVKEGWSKHDTLSLDIQMTDSVAGNVNAEFLIRNNSSYRYQDFAAIVQHNFPDTTRWRNYKVSFTLADSHGKWNGKGVGGLFESIVSLGKAHIAHPANYTFRVIHQMNDDKLLGIKDVGVIVKKEKENP